MTSADSRLFNIDIAIYLIFVLIFIDICHCSSCKDILKSKLTIWTWNLHTSKSSDVSATYTICAISGATLTIESRKLWLSLNKIVLAILHDHLVIDDSKLVHTLAFGLCIFISIFHLLFSLFHMTWPNWLYLIMKGSAKNILLVFDIEAWASSISLTLEWTTSNTLLAWPRHEVLIIAVLVWVHFTATGTLIVKVDIQFLIGQVEACSISHMHLETSWCKTLCLLVLDSSNLFFWMTDWSILLLVVLRILLHKLILKWLLVHMEFLAVARDSRLTWIDWSLYCCYHI